MSPRDSRASATSAASTTSGVALALIYLGDLALAIMYAADTIANAIEYHANNHAHNAPDYSEVIYSMAHSMGVAIGEVAAALFGLGDDIGSSIGDRLGEDR